MVNNTIMALLENQFAQQRLSRMIKRRKETFNKRITSGETDEESKFTRWMNGIFTDIFTEG